MHSQFSSISLFLIITKNIQNIQQHIHSVFEVRHSSDFIEKKSSTGIHTISMKYQYFDRAEVKEEYLMKCWQNRQKINQWKKLFGAMGCIFNLIILSTCI